MSKPKVLLIDIETAPMLGYVWGLWDQNIALNQIFKDWHVLSWSAKWLDSKEIMYMDQRNEADITKDKRILKHIWKLLDEADIVVGQNSKSFDHKKLNARFIQNGMQPPSTYKHIDTLLIAKKHFQFSSNKMEYTSEKLCTKYKKLKHHKFPGFDMWLQCLAGNREAWKEMEKYNKHDVLALEELYYKLMPWDNSINFNLYSNDASAMICSCGHSKFRNRGYYYTGTGKFQRYKCFKCGAESRSRENLFDKEKRKSLRTNTSRS